jgi:hypothetical protein
MQRVLIAHRGADSASLPRINLRAMRLSGGLEMIITPDKIDPLDLESVGRLPASEVVSVSPPILVKAPCNCFEFCLLVAATEHQGDEDWP